MAILALLWEALALARVVIEVLTNTAALLDALALAGSGVPVA